MSRDSCAITGDPQKPVSPTMLTQLDVVVTGGSGVVTGGDALAGGVDRRVDGAGRHGC